MLERIRLFETPRFAALLTRPGVTLERKADGASVYFQPGDDAAAAMRALGLEGPNQETLSPNPRAFDSAAADYF